MEFVRCTKAASRTTSHGILQISWRSRSSLKNTARRMSKGPTLDVADGTQLAAHVLGGQPATLDLVSRAAVVDRVNGLLREALSLEVQARARDAFGVVANGRVRSSNKSPLAHHSHATRPGLGQFGVVEFAQERVDLAKLFRTGGGLPS